MGDSEGAIEQYRKALVVNPNSVGALNNLGTTLTDKGLYVEAIECYQPALQLDPNQPTIHYNLGKARAEQGKRQEAAIHLKEALRLKPNHANPEPAQAIGSRLITVHRFMVEIRCIGVIRAIVSRRAEIQTLFNGTRTRLYESNQDFQSRKRQTSQFKSPVALDSQNSGQTCTQSNRPRFGSGDPARTS
jgi:tetratricopeptide (TPR) repeat protein